MYGLWWLERAESQHLVRIDALAAREGRQCLHLSRLKRALDCLQHTHVCQPLLRIRFRIDIVENAIGEILHLTTKVVCAFVTDLVLLIPEGKEMLKGLAVGIAWLHLKRSLGAEHRIGIDGISVVGHNEVRESPLRKTQHHGYRIVKVSKT